MAERAFEELQNRLIFLDIRPGEPINESQLSQELEVGRTPLREALKRLESEQLVTTFPRRGTFASTVDITVLSEISEVREVLEPLAARLAAQRSDESTREELARLKEDIRAFTMQGGDELRWDLAVHRALHAASGNSHLRVTLTRYGNLATRIWCLAATRNPTPSEHVTMHTDLLDAVIAGRAQDAEELMREHVVDFEHHMRRVL